MGEAAFFKALLSSARTTEVPTAMIRPPWLLAVAMARTVSSRISYRSLNGSCASKSGSPVDEIPAA